MDKYVITGKRPLEGKLTAMRSKNSTLPILAAALLAENGITKLHDVPQLRDIETMLKVLSQLGAKIEKNHATGDLTIDATNLASYEAPYDLVRQMRASFLVLGALIARCHRAQVSLPGGCSLGQRPVDLHLLGFSQLGVKISEDSGYVLADGQIQGGDVFFDRPSHTGTENIMIGAAVSKGRTRIINAACDPEVVDLANFLNKMGARISGAGSNLIEIEGVSSLSAVTYRPMADRLEVGTFLCMTAVTGGDVEISDCSGADLEIVIHKLREMGCTLTVGKNSVRIQSDGELKATNFLTFPYPGFPTDLQACFVACATLAKGTSKIRETVFDDRFGHCMELVRLGARITISGDVAQVEGVPALSGTTVMASDIRAGAGLVTACLAANGTSDVRRIYHIERGYDSLPEKLANLGASISRVAE